CFRCHESKKTGELDLERTNSPAYSTEKQNKLDKNRSDHKDPTYFVNSLKLRLGGVFAYKSVRCGTMYAKR
ncbi:hypothetical protein, partial [Bacillus vallismortis]|uniref:hypothetical protein n=1 Tax=Bacillus vallismortis TaxID=72361 RepID=UPI003B97FDC9